jgi:hypothetical protein
MVKKDQGQRLPARQTHSVEPKATAASGTWVAILKLLVHYFEKIIKILVLARR